MNTQETAQKLCECGCGQPAPIATKNHTKSGTVKGQPRRYIIGHNPKKRIEQPDEKPSGYCACGCGTPIYPSPIPTRQSRFANGHTGRWIDLTPEERFWQKVDKRGPDECWPWTGGSGGDGHGVFWNGSHITSAHRFAYILSYGPVADGIYICHHCDNPPCCNPAHLFAGTPADNVNDMLEKGRNNPMSQGSKGEKNGAARLTVAQVLDIREDHSNGITQAKLAKKYGMSQGAISNIIQRKNWIHI